MNVNDNGWLASADAWIAELGDHGDFGRRFVLDPVMLPLALARSPKTALDVGCGEGRFCRMLKTHGVKPIGVDPTADLIAAARARDLEGEYFEGAAEELAFDDASFDLVVSYLTLIDIPDVTRAIQEMARVLKPGGALLIANLNSFNTAGVQIGWQRGPRGEKRHFPVDHYLRERAFWSEWRGIRIVNHHRPLHAYMQLLLQCGLILSQFDEPAPTAEAPAARAADYVRAPWFVVMEWLKPA